MKTVRLLIVFAFLLAGCATAKPTAVPTVAEPTETSAPLPIATEVVELPTATSQPTDVPATSAPDVTQQAQTAILPLVGPCNNLSNPAISYSPSGDWMVVTCLGENQDGLTTKIVRTNGTKKWNISFNDVYIQPYKADDANLSKLLKETFIPVRWTVHEDFVYLAVPGSDENATYKGYDGLFRLDLSTGKSTPVLRPATAPLSASYAFKFSPTGTKLAYINQAVETIKVVMVDMGTGDENSFTLDARFTRGGGIVWSSDEKQLIVSAFDANTSGGGYALISYNFETNKNEYIIQQYPHAYSAYEWIDANTIYAENYMGSWVYINLATKEFTAAPAPTPVP